MTYAGFHLRFNVPLLLILSLLAYRSWNFSDTIATGILCLIAIVFTSPWDNFALKKGFWNFPEGRIWFRIGHCPIEEYAFFVIQTIQGCLLTDYLRYFFQVQIPSEPNWSACGIFLLIWAVSWIITRRWKRPSSIDYLWHLLFWLVPIIVLQWLIGGIFVSQPILVLSSTFILGTLLSVFDGIAIRNGIWKINGQHVLRKNIAGILPIEEVAFFYLTSILVAQGFILLTLSHE